MRHLKDPPPPKKVADKYSLWSLRGQVFLFFVCGRVARCQWGRGTHNPDSHARSNAIAHLLAAERRQQLVRDSQLCLSSISPVRSNTVYCTKRRRNFPTFSFFLAVLQCYVMKMLFISWHAQLLLKERAQRKNAKRQTQLGTSNPFSANIQVSFRLKFTHSLTFILKFGTLNPI